MIVKKVFIVNNLFRPVCSLDLAQPIPLALRDQPSRLVHDGERIHVSDLRFELDLALSARADFISRPLSVANEVALVHQMAAKRDVVDTYAKL